MSSVLHPVGPEEPSTYWIRRGVVVLIVVLLIALLAWLIGLAGNGDEQTSGPPNEQPAAPAATPSTPAPSGPASPAPSASASAEGSPSARPSATPTGPVACAGGDLRVTVDGPGEVKAGKRVELKVSVINNGSQSCRLELSGKNAEVRVASGTDRIFSTAHCERWQPEVKKTVASQKSADWSTRWGANRTADDCKISEQKLQPGTYVATVEIDGVAPAQHVMRLTA